MLSVILLAVSLSLDAFGVAFAYGLKKTTIPIGSRLILAASTLLYFGFAVFLGKFLGSLLNPKAASVVGIVLMAFICLWMLIQVLVQRPDTPQEKPAKKKTLLNITLKSLGISIRIIKNPMLCDMDQSKSIGAIEAIYLGLALSVDSISVGIGYAMSGGVVAAAPLFAGMAQFLFAWAGNTLGLRLGGIAGMKQQYMQIVSCAAMFFLLILRIFNL